MPTERIIPIARRSSGLLRIFLAFVVLASSIMLAGTSGGRGSMRPAQAAPLRAASDSELFGMVTRDPFYEYNTDPVNYPNAANRTALERQATELQAAGVKWVRMEFFADYDGSVAAGDINWAKYDWFIKELAPK